MFTFEKWPLVAELKSKVSKKQQIRPFCLSRSHTFDIFGHLVKKLFLRFLKDGLVTKLLRETCKGGVIFKYRYTYEETLSDVIVLVF